MNKAARIPTGVGSYQHVPAPLADVVGWMYLGTFPGAEGTFHTSHSLDFLPYGKHSGDAAHRVPTPVAYSTTEGR